MLHDKNTHLKKIIIAPHRFIKLFQFYMGEQFQSRLVRIRLKQLFFIWSKKIFLSFKLFTTDPQEKSCLRNWFPIIHMVLKKAI